MPRARSVPKADYTQRVFTFMYPPFVPLRGHELFFSFTDELAPPTTGVTFGHHQRIDTLFHRPPPQPAHLVCSPQVAEMYRQILHSNIRAFEDCSGTYDGSPCPDPSTL